MVKRLLKSSWIVVSWRSRWVCEAQVSWIFVCRSSLWCGLVVQISFSSFYGGMFVGTAVRIFLILVSTACPTVQKIILLRGLEL